MYKSSRNYHNLRNLLVKEVAYTVALIDIDDFVNTFCNESYSIVITNIYKFLSNNSPYKIVYLGKDEFGIYSVDSHESTSTFMTNLLESNTNFNKKFNTSFSTAIAEYPYSGEDEIEILRGLEESLHNIKKKNRGGIEIVKNLKMKLKSNYYTVKQLERLSELAEVQQRSEASILREALDLILREYES
ncbi:hypothetical protein [Priestia flexa]|uniref:hypothetical protein n=1 Tax=Priestia flexa TaxID=86664 RepID=UPI00077CAE9D|nr:hypothetical protein [Priestia flexa]MED4590512.1 hypothetical protein [Priestia flexa]